MLENYEKKIREQENWNQEPASLIPQTREHVLEDINICLFTYLE